MSLECWEVSEECGVARAFANFLIGMELSVNNFSKLEKCCQVFVLEYDRVQFISKLSSH